MQTSATAQTAPKVTVCSLCSGHGQDPTAPCRQTALGVIQVVRACPVCDGHGFVTITQIQ